ncbi:hypothetical protein FEM48_Zijuj05G0036200 [Ziziphus jujuba var. spinosa]|uniref:Uncharacterized protein n=1 Tax=Ziziphus jujuba var. spinosa TaxID=714518 RepID=A0A978VCL2_ZIZJJ|nr:hypothetical protein FEM48_Zijuj05G0036200 [Ziziphus jujuba var. spinosa]
MRGYLAPEYAMRGQLTEKTDIFAFDVLTLATVSGRPNSDMSLDEKTSLLGWVWNLNKEGRELEVVDSAITLSGLNEEQIRRVIRIALLCTQTSPSLRPTMSCVVAMLLGDVQVTNEITTPGFLSDRKFESLIRSISDTAARGTFTSFYNASAGTSMVSNAGQSVINANQYPMLQDSVREGFPINLWSKHSNQIATSQKGIWHPQQATQQEEEVPSEEDVVIKAEAKEEEIIMSKEISWAVGRSLSVVSNVVQISGEDFLSSHFHTGSASALEVVLKKVSGLVVGIACSGIVGLRDASINALHGLACIDPDLVWLLVDDVYYYSVMKKDKP